MRKKLLTTGVALASFFSMYAGDLLTNTNQNVTFLRNPARDASIEIDAAYTNPAGLAFLKKDGFFISLNNQSAFQTRTITTDFAPFAGNGGSAVKAFKGEVSSYLIPNLQAALKKGNWTISANIGVVGGGGTLDFKNGLPSFESQVAIVPEVLQQGGISATKYSLDSRLKGSSATLGIQLGVTYKISEQFSAYLGGRLSFVNNSYDGYLRNIQILMDNGTTKVGDYLTAAAAQATAAATQATGVANSLQPIINGGYGGAPLSTLVSAGILTQTQVDQMAAGLGFSSAQAGAMTVSQMQGGYNQAAQMATQIALKATGTAAQIAANTGDKGLNCKQTGFGAAPIIGFDYKWNGLNIGARYEFKTVMDLTNKTTTNTTDMPAYNDGATTPYDIPALLTVGAQYDIIPQLTVSAGYHHFFDSDARIADNRQKLISGVNEYLAGLEYRINKMFLVSCGAQFTNPKSKDNFMSDINFDINSLSVGLGGAINLTENIRINLAYLFTNYYKRTVNSADYHGLSAMNGIVPAIPATDVYNRTSKAFGIGLDFRF